MARRNVFSGASAWEREERAIQQRDYAAQLQAQVLQKQAKQEQEKARRQQEQREELEMLERERAAATRKRQPQQEEKTPEPSLPAPSPQRSVSMAHTLVVESQGAHVPSRLKTVSSGPDFTCAGTLGTDPVQHFPAAKSTTNFASESYTPTFNSTVSIFETLLREPGIGARSNAFYDDLAVLQRLATELDSAATQRRRKAQDTYVKPDFLHQQDTSEISPTTISLAALHSPVKPNETKVVCCQPRRQSAGQHAHNAASKKTIMSRRIVRGKHTASSQYITELFEYEAEVDTTRKWASK